ncbi:uncharacterized protein Dere_GG12239 [Drosophila erecta]|uniref:GG12239 n=1 Tax=Drosophila erecta TaxID=7220 RepID=B3P6I4_DROER|nr:uncharacterized protein Dere_GG12239 [Drosophila erecta]
MGNAAHVAIIGHWKKSDMLLLNQNIFVQGRKRAKVSHKFHYTQKSDPKVISAVVLTNYDKSTFGAEGSLLEGGPNNIYCSIRLSARNNHDINFNLKIYSNNNVLQ